MGRGWVARLLLLSWFTTSRDALGPLALYAWFAVSLLWCWWWWWRRWLFFFLFIILFFLSLVFDGVESIVGCLTGGTLRFTCLRPFGY